LSIPGSASRLLAKDYLVRGTLAANEMRYNSGITKPRLSRGRGFLFLTDTEVDTDNGSCMQESPAAIGLLPHKCSVHFI